MPENNCNKPKEKQPARKKDFGFFYDVVKLVSGNGFVQVFRTVLSPIISRLFLPEFFGVTQNFSSIANIFAVISSLQYDQTIMLPKEKEKAANQLGVSLFFLFILTPLSFIIIWLFKDNISNLLNSPQLTSFLWLVPIQVFAIGSFNVFKQWNARDRKFFRLSITQVTNEVAADGMTAGFGFANLASSNTMIISRISGQLLASLTLGSLVLKEDGKFIFNHIRWEEMISGMKEYIKFPQFNVWASFLSTLSLYLPGILLSAYFSPTTAGYFALGQSVLRMPIALIGNSIGQVFFQRGAKSFNEGKFTAIVDETFKRLIIFGVFPMLVVMIIGKELFTIAFGPEWSEAGKYSQILSLWTLTIFIAAPLSNVTNILGKNEVSVILNILKVILAVGSFVIGGITGNIYLGLWLFSITGVLTYGGYIFWATSASGIPPKKALKYVLDNLIQSAPFLMLIYLFQRFNPLPDISITKLKFSLPYIGVILFSIFIGIIYYSISILRDPSIREALNIMRKKYFKK
ncbi:MAG: oligosaccharide flippase family protein [Pelolinea sp.]|nr:oligosaccharide flippase family protein [Pelolinea sp.]